MNNSPRVSRLKPWKDGTNNIGANPEHTCREIRLKPIRSWKENNCLSLVFISQSRVKDKGASWAQSILEGPRVPKCKFLVSVHIQLDAVQYVQWNRLSLDCVQVYTIRPCPDVSIFVKNAQVFFSFFILLFPHVEFLCRFCSSRCVHFRLKAQKPFPFLIISPSTHGFFDTVTSSFSKSSVFKSLHENTKTALSHVNPSLPKSSISV